MGGCACRSRHAPQQASRKPTPRITVHRAVDGRRDERPLPREERHGRRRAYPHRTHLRLRRRARRCAAGRRRVMPRRAGQPQCTRPGSGPLIAACSPPCPCQAAVPPHSIHTVPHHADAPTLPPPPARWTSLTWSPASTPPPARPTAPTPPRGGATRCALRRRLRGQHRRPAPAAATEEHRLVSWPLRPASPCCRTHPALFCTPPLHRCPPVPRRLPGWPAARGDHHLRGHQGRGRLRLRGARLPVPVSSRQISRGAPLLPTRLGWAPTACSRALMPWRPHTSRRCSHIAQP